MRKNKNSLLSSLIFTVALFTAAALLLSTVHLLTKDRIADQKQRQMQENFNAVYENFDTYDIVMGNVDLQGCAKEIYKVYAYGHILQGFAVKATPAGYGSQIELLVAMDKNAKILRVFVLSTTDTIGMDYGIYDEEYLASFQGKNTNLHLDQEIISVDGALTSCQMLLTGVNDATATCRKWRGLEAK